MADTVQAQAPAQGQEFDPRTFPSSVGIDILLADQLGEYSKKDLQKIAMDIKAGVPHADEAFHYVYSRMMGWN